MSGIPYTQVPLTRGYDPVRQTEVKAQREREAQEAREAFEREFKRLRVHHLLATSKHRTRTLTRAQKTTRIATARRRWLEESKEST